MQNRSGARVIATDYEVLGLTSGDWPLSGKFLYIGRSFISLWCVLDAVDVERFTDESVRGPVRYYTTIRVVDALAASAGPV